jgi:hypothetical protein
MRRTGRSLLAVTGVIAALGGAALETTSAAAAAAGPGSNSRVIVVFKNQETNLPPTPALVAQRNSAVAGVQAPVTSQMASSGATNIQSYSVVNAVSATVSPSEASQLKANPAVSEVIPDQLIQLAPPESFGHGQGGWPGSATPGVCSSNPRRPQLNPEALEAINADSDQPGAQTARSLGITGAGVKVAYIADGLDTQNPDFMRNGSSVFFDYKDFTGAGTSAPTGGEEAFGDASSIAAQGNQVYNVQNYSALPLRQPCYIRVEGVAPGASLAGLVAFTGDSGFNSSILEAINYAVNVDHVNVLNESFGSNFYPDDSASLDVIKQADEAAVAAGTVVVVSSGDAGVTSTIGTPATDPAVISAGATTTYRLDAQDGYGGSRFPGVRGYLSNNISSLSSGGFDQAGGTVDVVAPGELNWVLCTPNLTLYSECDSLAGNPSPVIAFGGTSESAPLTAGVAALVMQAYKKTHGSFPTPAVVKQIITSTASDIGAPADQQGSGLVNAYKAVQAAESYQTNGVGNTLLESSSQLNAVAGTGTQETLNDTITNNGSTPQFLRVSSRTLGAYNTLRTATVNLSDSSSPKVTDWQGVSNNVQSVTFAVPAGEDRLDAAIAFQIPGQYLANSLNARVRLTLVDSQGRLAGYSVPQGDGNYGDIQVTDPAPGLWTAYIYSRDSADGGTTGPVVFTASAARYTSFGTVSPSFLRLNPGQSAPVTLNVTTPAQPGDVAGSIVLSSFRDDGATTIPVTLRSEVPTGPTSWNDTLTGGNGRAVNTGEAFYYQVNLPAGEPELNADVTLADNPNNTFSAFLIDPNGEAEAYTSNSLLSAGAGGLGATNQLGGQLHVLNPAQGQWTLVVLYAPTVSGTATSEPFNVSMNEQPVPAQAPTLPDSASTKLTAGQSYTYDVTVHNNGNSPETYFVDPRLSTSATMPLTSLTNPVAQMPLTFSGNIPVYLVPSDTTAIAEEAQVQGGSEPIMFDSSSPLGDPDLGSPLGTDVTASLSANPVTPGEWSIAPTVVGPFGASGTTTTETVNTTMSATAPAFNTDVTTADGDLWQMSVGGPLVLGTEVDPGQSATIPVTITPSGTSGTQVSGTLYLDDEQALIFGGESLSPNANQLAAIPYAYSVK